MTRPSTPDRVAHRYRTALVRTIDESWVEKLRKDFLVLMKNLPKVRDYATGDELRAGFKAYQKNFKLWVFEEFLNPQKERDDASFEGLRKPAWDFYIELRLPLGYPDDYNTEESLLVGFERERRKWEQRLRGKAQDCWKAFKQYLGWKTEKKVDVEVADQDRLILEGFQVDIIGHDPSETWQDDAFSRFKEALRLYRHKAKVRMPWLLQKQLPLVLTFKGKLDEGGTYEGSHIRVSMSAMINQPPEWGVHMLAHEMGHHLFKHLSKPSELYWYAAIRQDYGPIDLQDVMALWPETVTWTDDFAQELVEKDPILSLQLDVLSRERGGNAGWEKRERFQRALDEGGKTVAVPKHPITGYAGKNPEESFCEAIGRLVGYGPRTVLPQVREWLETVIPGMIKTARTARTIPVDKASIRQLTDWQARQHQVARVAESYLASRAIQADYDRLGLTDCVDTRQDAAPFLNWLRTGVGDPLAKPETHHRVLARYLDARAVEAKAKGKGLSLLPDYKKALEKLQGGDAEPTKEFAERVKRILFPDEGRPDWFSALSTQKMNAIRALNRGIQSFLAQIGHLREHPQLLSVFVKDVEKWAKPLRTLEIASALGDTALEIERGSFVVVPIPGVTKAQTDGALEALDEAVSKIRPKCPGVLYGKVFFSTHLQKGTAAWYEASSDTLSLNVLAKKRFSDVFTIIHELGHRHDSKFLSKDGREKYWALSTRKVYETIHFDAKLREQMADEGVKLAKLKIIGKPLPAPSETLVWWLKSPHPHAQGDVRTLTTAFLNYQIDEKQLHAAIKGKADADVMTDKLLHGPLAVTPYGATKPKENYADGFAHFILGMDMPPELAVILAEEVK